MKLISLAFTLFVQSDSLNSVFLVRYILIFKWNDELKAMLNMASVNKKIMAYIGNINVFMRKQGWAYLISSNS